MHSALTRRDFLGRAACAIGTLGVSRLAAQQAGMFVSLNGALTPKIGGTDKVRLAAKLGFGGVDWDFGPAKAAGLDATKALFAELKVKPTIASLPMSRPLPFAGDGPAFQEGLKLLADDASFISGTGCRKMMVVLPATAPVSKEEYRKIVVERVAAISEVIRKADLRLGMEFLGPLYMRQGPGRDGQPRTPFIWTLPETVALAKDCGSNIGAVLDVWHWHHSGGTVADILAAGDRIVHVHISDAKPAPPEDVRDNQRFMPGEGSIDLIAFLQALKKAGYSDGVSPEPLGRIPPEMPAEEAAKLGLETTLAVMKKAGVA